MAGTNDMFIEAEVEVVGRSYLPERLRGLVRPLPEELAADEAVAEFLAATGGREYRTLAFLMPHRGEVTLRSAVQGWAFGSDGLVPLKGRKVPLRALKNRLYANQHGRGVVTAGFVTPLLRSEAEKSPYVEVGCAAFCPPPADDPARVLRAGRAHAVAEVARMVAEAADGETTRQRLLCYVGLKNCYYGVAYEGAEFTSLQATLAWLAPAGVVLPDFDDTSAVVREHVNLS